LLLLGRSSQERGGSRSTKDEGAVEDEELVRPETEKHGRRKWSQGGGGTRELRRDGTRARHVLLGSATETPHPSRSVLPCHRACCCLPPVPGRSQISTDDRVWSILFSGADCSMCRILSCLSISATVLMCKEPKRTIYLFKKK
jgi:hypothetical protein